MLRTLLFLTAFCILASGNARAAVPIDEAGAENIRTIVQTLLDRQKAVRELSGGALETKGVLTVEMARTYYAITLPHITLVDPAGRRAEIGMIALNATPAGQEGKWRLSIALPTPMTWFDTEGNLSMRVHLGAQQLSGVWDEALETATEWLQDVRMRDPKRLAFFTARYAPADRVFAGGGKPEEGEDIEVLEPTLDQALGMVRSGEIADAKTVILLWHVKLYGLG